VERAGGRVKKPPLPGPLLPRREEREKRSSAETIKERWLEGDA